MIDPETVTYTSVPAPLEYFIEGRKIMLAQQPGADVRDNVAMVVESFNRDVCEERDVLKRENRKLAADRADLIAALELACGIADGLADQQAMQDDWYIEPLKHARAVIAKHR